MNITLTGQLESFVQTEIENGFYNSPQDVMAESLTLLRDFQMLKKMRFDREIQKGMDEIAEGKGISWEQCYHALKDELDLK